MEGQSIDLYSDKFLMQRPLLEVLRDPVNSLLLIDEIDRSDHEFEAYLLEFLSDFTISIPELGTERAIQAPIVILTSNRVRDLHEALRRRCVYHWLNYPDASLEAQIVMIRASGVAEATARAIVDSVGRLRQEPLAKPPGVSESVEWAEAATLLNKQGLDWPQSFVQSLGVAIKDQNDLEYLAGRFDAVLPGAMA